MNHSLSARLTLKMRHWGRGFLRAGELPSVQVSEMGGTGLLRKLFCHWVRDVWCLDRPMGEGRPWCMCGGSAFLFTHVRGSKQ